MPKWYFSKEGLLRTPSRLDGIDFMTEARYRREGARFIMDCGNKMKLRYDTMATGAVYFHRFYMIQSFKNFPRYVTGAACLFLAGKVEETPKKCKDIIKMARSLLPDSQFEAFGTDPREEVMMYERILLQTIKFDLQVEHPYQNLLKFGKALKGDRDKLNKLVQMGWTFINDSLSMTLCLQYKPEVIAVGMLYLAGKLNNYDLQSATSAPPGKPWWTAFVKNVSEPMLEDICDVMLELYGGKKKDTSDHSADSSNTSSPAGYSPSTKKRRTTSASEPKTPAPVDLKSESKRSTVATPPVTMQAAVTQANTVNQTQLLVENISPAPTPGQASVSIATTAGTASTEQKQSGQGKESSVLKEAIPPPPTTEVPPPAAPLPPLSSLPPFPSSGTFGSMQSYVPTVSQTSSSYLASFQSNYGQGTVPSYQLNTQFQTQSFLPPTMGYTMTQPAQSAAFQQPAQPTATSSLYAIPAGNLNALQNPPNFGTPPPVQRPPNMGQPPPNVPPPPLPPLSGGQLPPPPPMAGGSRDFGWSKQYNLPPSQQPNMGGGWMR